MFDTFLTFTGTGAPTGETTDTALPKNIAVKSFDFGVANNSRVTSDAPGSSSGKAVLSNFNFTKMIDNASPDLHQACCLGIHFPTAEIQVRRAGTGQLTY